MRADFDICMSQWDRACLAWNSVFAVGKYTMPTRHFLKLFGERCFRMESRRGCLPLSSFRLAIAGARAQDSSKTLLLQIIQRPGPACTQEALRKEYNPSSYHSVSTSPSVAFFRQRWFACTQQSISSSSTSSTTLTLVCTSPGRE